MQWDVSKQVGKKIAIRTKAKLLCFDIERIKYILCDGHHCTVYLVDNSEHRVTRSLKYFEEKLEGMGFIRSNRYTLVNKRYIYDVHLSNDKKTLHVKITKSEPLPVSKRNVHLFKDV